MRRIARSTVVRWVALLGLSTIVPTADLAAQPGGATNAAAQKAKASDEARAPAKNDNAGEGEGAQAPAPQTDEELNFERPRELNLLTLEEMTSLAAKYEADIENDVSNVEAARTSAYKNRDVIKLTCIDDKLVQMRLISHSMTPRFKRMLRLKREEFAVRAEFSIITPNWKRSKELRQEVETCIGETLNAVSVVSVSQETPEPTPGPDPTAAPGPKVNSERLPEASPYR